MAHPEVLVESLNEFQKKQEAAEAEAQREALVSRQDELFKNPASPVLGNPKGDVTLVEFFDYQCGYCKAVHADVRRLIDSDTKIRLVYRSSRSWGLPPSPRRARRWRLSGKANTTRFMWR